MYKISKNNHNILIKNIDRQIIFKEIVTYILEPKLNL
jgi:hypothetical protein